MSMGTNVLRGVIVAMTAPALLAAQGAPGATGQPDARAVQCGQAQAGIGVAIDTALARLETARQANSPTAMRAANDDLQGALLDIRARLAPCAALATTGGGESPAMPHMPGMPGMPGMRGMPGKPDAPGDAAAPGAEPHAGHVMPPAEGTAKPSAPEPAPAEGAATPPPPATHVH